MVAFSSAGFFSSITTMGKPVQKDHHIGAARVLAFRHGELVHRDPVVVLRVVEVQHMDLRTRQWSHPARVYSTLTPSTSMRCRSRLRVISDGPVNPR